MLKRLFGIFLFCFVLSNCSKQQEQTELNIYATVYPETLKVFEKAFNEKHPNIKIKWYQNGGENIASKIAVERLGKDITADIVVGSDVFWFRKMAREDLWESYTPKVDYALPSAWTGEKGSFTSPRVSAMVIVYNTKFMSADEAPKSFQELADPKFKGKISTGSPLESGTNYTFYMNTAFRYGYDFLKKLRENDVMAAGGNSAVLMRVNTGERPVGIMVMESYLNEKKRNPDLAVVYPADGVVVIPGPMAIVKGTKELEAAKTFYDFMMSSEGQKLNSESLVYVPDPKAPTPEGVKSLADLIPDSFNMSDEFFKFVENEEASFKDKFASIMFE